MELTTQEDQEARDWLSDCFPHSEDYIQIEASPYEIRRAVANHYDGGLAQFLADGS